MSKLDEFINESIKLLNKNNKLLEDIKEKICKDLEKIFDNDNVTIIGRVKTEKSLREKIIRNNYFKRFHSNPQELIENLSDMIGIRINCLLTRDEINYFNKLKSHCMKVSEDKYGYSIKDQENSEGFFINLDSKQPEVQKNGKDIYRIDATYKNNDLKFNIEIQIKSSINSLWGEIEHKLFYKNYEYLSSQEFYKNLMMLIYENLDSVESQLELLKDHIENDSKDIDQAIDFLSKLLYRTYKNECAKLAYNSNIDFRTICKLVCELYFTTPQNAFRELQQSIDIVREIKLFRFTTESEMKVNKMSINTNCNENMKKFAYNIDKMVIGENVYWRVLINIYSIIAKTENYTDTIINLANKLNSNLSEILNLIINDINEDELMEEVPDIFDVIMDSSNEFLSSYEKYEMFLDKNLDIFKNVLLKMFKLNKYLIKEKRKNISEDFIKRYIIFIYKIIILNKVELNELKDLLQNAEFSIIGKDIEMELKSVCEENDEDINTSKIIGMIIKEDEVKYID